MKFPVRNADANVKEGNNTHSKRYSPFTDPYGTRFSVSRTFASEPAVVPLSGIHVHDGQTVVMADEHKFVAQER